MRKNFDIVLLPIIKYDNMYLVSTLRKSACEEQQKFKRFKNK